MAANPERKPGSNLGRSTTDWEAAFAFWASLPQDQRRYGAVAERFSVSVRTVEKRGRVAGWAKRLQLIQAKAAVQADAKLARAWSDQLAEFEKLIEASMITYAQQRRSCGVRITASEFVGLVKLVLQLRGEPTERVELIADFEEWIGLRTRIL